MIEKIVGLVSLITVALLLLLPVGVTITPDVVYAHPAAPVVANWTVADSGAATTTTITLTKPADVEVDDLLLIIVGSDQDTVADWNAVTGWTQFININDGVGDANLAVYWRICDGNEDATTDVTGPSVEERYGWYIRVTGAAVFAPIHLIGTPVYTTDNPHNVLEVTTTADDCLVFYGMAFDGGDAGGFTESGAGWTEVDEQYSGTAGTDACGVWGTKTMSGQGGTGDVSITTGDASDGHSSIQFAVQPPSLPSATSQNVTNILRTKAFGHGTITGTGGEEVTKRGICWNTGGNPDVNDDKVEEEGSFSTGTFSLNTTATLSGGTLYYAKAYAYNLVGYSYGAQVEFTTLPVDCEVLFPDATGDEESITTAVPDVDHYLNVDEEFHDDDTSHIKTQSDTFLRDLYNLPASSGSGTIDKIVVHIRCQSDAIGETPAYKVSIKSNSTITDGDTQNAAEFNTWEDFTQEWTLNPADSQAWEWSDIDALQIGASLVGFDAVSKSAYLTQVYVVVYFTTDGAPDISNTPASVGFGVVNTTSNYWSKGSEPSWPLDDSECFFEVTNNSGAAVDISIVATNFTGGDGWTLSSSAGENIVVLKAGKSGDANEDAMVTLTTSPQSFITGLADSASIKWEVKIETGTFTDGVLKEATITLTAALQ